MPVWLGGACRGSFGARRLAGSAGAAFFAISMMDRASVSGMRSASIGMGGAVAVPRRAARGTNIGSARGGRSRPQPGAELGRTRLGDGARNYLHDFPRVFLYFSSPPRRPICRRRGLLDLDLSVYRRPRPILSAPETARPHGALRLFVRAISAEVSGLEIPAGGVYGKKANT